LYFSFSACIFSPEHTFPWKNPWHFKKSFSFRKNDFLWLGKKIGR